MTDFEKNAIIYITKHKGVTWKMLNTDVLKKLMLLHADNKQILNIIFDALWSFEEYHNCIVKMELSCLTYTTKVLERADYQYMVKDLDEKRTMRHNSVLASVNMLNRLAANEGLDPVYDGIVSEERPYRREVADAVLEYVEQIIKNRQ